MQINGKTNDNNKAKDLSYYSFDKGSNANLLREQENLIITDNISSEM